MSENVTQIEFSPATFDRWLAQAGDATITDEDMEALLRRYLALHANVDLRSKEGVKRKLQTAINSYCHILCITREYRDEDVDLETSLGLIAKCSRGEPLTDTDIRLIGKRGSDSRADMNLETAFWRIYTTLSDEQFAVLAASLFEQAIVHGTGSLSDKAWFAESASKCLKQARRLFIAQHISLLTEEHDCALRYSKMSPEKKADHDRFMESLDWMFHGPAD